MVPFTPWMKLWKGLPYLPYFAANSRRKLSRSSSSNLVYFENLSLSSIVLAKGIRWSLSTSSRFKSNLSISIRV